MQALAHHALGTHRGNAPPKALSLMATAMDKQLVAEAKAAKERLQRQHAEGELREAAEAAQSALTHVITSNEHGKDKQLLPKELLQACLRPVLSRLQSHRKLTRHLLRGLARLLYLLSNWFNVTLGEKLLEVFISLFVNI